ncbi:EAL domain-containing protein [Azonexus sp.]|uniref:EAL domain-containing protein n=1 Tax=Azonexus sp. TaxID=1872668 RepID=UPI0027BA090B|nr:EAL domain-containing protein [Azonexus sp.]
MTERMKAYHPWQILVILLLTALVTGLFFKAGVVSPEAHYRYARTLRQFQQLDEQLNSTVVASYAGLVQNYDGMARYLGKLRETGESMRDMPDWLEESERIKIAQQIDSLMAVYEEKSIEVDRFQRANSVLRNSILYLPQAAEAVLAQQSVAQKDEFEDFIRRLIGSSLARNLDETDAQRLHADLARLRKLIRPTDYELSMNQVLIHAELIMERSPEVEGLVNKIVRIPITPLHEQVMRAYLEAYQAATDRAARYRVLLYAVSLLLVGYALYALFRIDRDRRALRRAHADLAERYEAQRRAEDELRLYGTVFTHAAEGMTITDAQSRIVAVNPAFCAITGYSPDEVIGRTPALLNSGRQGEDFYRHMWAALQETGLWQGEIWNRRKDGGIFPEWLSIAAVRDRAGESKHYIGVFTDISERKESEAQIHHLAHHDALTGLPNRLLLEDRIEQGMLMSRRAGRQMAIIFIDLDRFKNINDTLGHEVGDNLLIQAAERGRAVLRDTDTLCRLGGDEFVAVLPQLENCQDAAHICRKMLAALCQPYLLAGHELTVSGSAGIALYPDDGESVSELLRKADAAMYRAKEDGRNTFWYFSAEINTATLGELLLENDLFGALERDELLMYYQPKVDAQHGKIVAAEALMRWRHRERGLISPTQFIPMAEENGLINAFGEWAIRKVCAQQRAWLDAGLLVVPVAVNISAHQFAQQDLPNMLAHVLAEYGLPPQLIELELTESLLMRNSTLAASVLQTLHKMHIQVAIDDFGTGYSSLSYLHQFPVQQLKIDRSFVSLIDEQGESVRLASAIIAMAHELGLTVIAEGVENEAQRRYLAEHGCDEFQGYLFGRPQVPDAFGKLLAQRVLGNAA